PRAMSANWSEAASFFASERGALVREVSERLAARLPARTERTQLEASPAWSFWSRLRALTTGRLQLRPEQIAEIADALAQGLRLFEDGERPSSRLLLQTRTRLHDAYWFLE